MKFKEFKKWCNDRWFDGCWGKNEAMECLMALDYMKVIPFWKREKIWQRDCAEYIVPIVEATNKKIEEMSKTPEDKIIHKRGWFIYDS